MTNDRLETLRRSNGERMTRLAREGLMLNPINLLKERIDQATTFLFDRLGVSEEERHAFEAEWEEYVAERRAAAEAESARRRLETPGGLVVPGSDSAS